MERFLITATCDPYNARRHYHGQEVLKWSGATPSEWVIREYGSEAEARADLENMFCIDNAVNTDIVKLDSLGDLHDYCEELAGIPNDLVDEDKYQGPGYYWSEDLALIFLKGEAQSYTNDTMTFHVRMI